MSGQEIIGPKNPSPSDDARAMGLPGPQPSFKAPRSHVDKTPLIRAAAWCAAIVSAVSLPVGCAAGVYASKPIVPVTATSESTIDATDVHVTDVEGISDLMLTKGTIDFSVTAVRTIDFKNIAAKLPDFLKNTTRTTITTTYNPAKIPGYLITGFESGKIKREVRPKVPLVSDRTAEQKDLPTVVTLTVPNGSGPESGLKNYVILPLLPDGKKSAPEYTDQVVGALAAGQAFDLVIGALDPKSPLRKNGMVAREILTMPTKDAAKKAAVAAIAESCSKAIMENPATKKTAESALKAFELNVAEAYIAPFNEKLAKGLTPDDITVNFVDSKKQNESAGPVEVTNLTPVQEGTDPKTEADLNNYLTTTYRNTTFDVKTGCNVEPGAFSLLDVVGSKK